MNSIKNFFRLSSMLIAYIFLCGCPPSTDNGADLYTASSTGSCTFEDQPLYAIAASSDNSIIIGGSGGSTADPGYAIIIDSSCNRIGDTIEGDHAGDYFGTSVTMSANGKRIAIGAPKHLGIDGVTQNVGIVRVYDYDEINEQWILKKTIYGETADDELGSSVAMSANAQVLAIGAPLYANAGRVYIYPNLDNDSDPNFRYVIDPPFRPDTTFGSALSLSADGNTLAIASPSLPDPNEQNEALTHGFVQCYTFSNDVWSQLGSTIEGVGTDIVDTENNFFGKFIALRKNGKSLLIGAAYVNDQQQEMVQLYSLKNNDWTRDTTLTKSTVTESSTSTVTSGVGATKTADVDGFGNSLSFAYETSPYSDAPIFAVGGVLKGYVRIYQQNQNGDVTLLTTINQGPLFGTSIAFDATQSKLSISSPLENKILHYELAESLNSDFFQLLQEALLTYQPSGSTNPIQPGGASGGDGGNTITTQTKGLHQLILDIILDNETVADQLSELIIELISDDPTNSFTVLVDPYQNATFSVNKFIGKATSSSDGSQLLFTQQTGTEVIGTLTEADGTVTTNVKLSGAVIQGADFDPSQTTVSDDNKTISMNITSGNIIQGTFVVPSPTVTLTLVSDTVEDTFTLDDTIFTQFPSGTTFAFSGIAGTLAGGTLNGAQTLLTGSTVTQTGSVSGTLTIPSGDYAGTYENVNLTGATITSVSVVGTTTSSTFSGTDVKNNGDTAKINTGTFDIKFIRIPASTPSSYTISGGDFDGQTFTTTSGFISGRVTSGSLPGTITFTQSEGSSGSIKGSIPSPGTGATANYTGTFTDVPVETDPYSETTITNLEASGAYDTSGTIFTATSVHSGSLIDPGGLFTVTIIVDTTNVSTSFDIETFDPSYDTRTCTFNTPNSLSGSLSSGVFNANGTSYSGENAELVFNPASCFDVTLTNPSENATLSDSSFPITIGSVDSKSTLNVTGSFTGLNFTATAITSGTITSGDFTFDGSCSDIGM